MNLPDWWNHDKPYIIGDCLEQMKLLPDKVIQCCVTSPPYWGLRDYGVDGQLGLEETPEAYVEKLVEVFREVKRILRDDGTLWLNLGDSYCSTAPGTKNAPGQLGAESKMGQRTANHLANMRPNTPDGLKPKDLVGIPWRVAFALQADGWYLRSDIIWHKPNPMPESVTDRPTKSHEYIFLLTKNAKYYYDAEAIKEQSTGQTGLSANFKRDTKETLVPGQTVTNHRLNRTPTEDNGYRNKRSVWTITTKPYKEAHFATFPTELPELCIKAGTKKNDIVFDPFLGSGTVAEVARLNERIGLGIELNPDYKPLIIERSMANIKPLEGYF